MDAFNRNNPEEEQQTTPFQTPVRGADEQPGSGYQYAGDTYPSSTGNGGSTPPPHDTRSAYEQWSNGKKPKKNKSNKNRKFPWKPVVAGVLIAAIAFGGGMAAGGGLDFSSFQPDSNAGVTNGSGTTATNSTQVQISNKAEDMASYSDVYEKVSPSIVAVVVDAIQMGSESSGSGVIMSKDGYVITNNHVVSGGDRFTVVLSDSTTYEATLVGTDEQTDLAVLKIKANGLTAAEFGDSDNVKVGDRAFAIGSPGGVQYQNSFTGGFISAINRNVTINDRTMTLIQTDTAINPGNSGGALINASGQVIGITSSKLSGSSSADSASIEGMGFAIPMSTTKEIVDELIAYGHVTGRPAIGISGYDIDETRAAYFNLPRGVYVSSVDTASDAYKKGIQAGDIITGVNGKEITGMSEINTVKSELKAGDTIKLTVYRSGETKEYTITLIDEADLSGTSAESSSSSTQDNSSNPYSGYGYGGYIIP